MTRDPLAYAARRHAHAVAGHILIAAEPCAVPASVLTVDMLIEQAAELRAAEKYSLRALLEGIDDIQDLQLFLGLDQGETADVVAALLQHEYIDYRPAGPSEPRRLSLLPAGQEAARDAILKQPQATTAPVVYDRLAGRPTNWTRRSLIRAKAARREGTRLLLPPTTSQPVGLESITPANLAESLSRGAKDSVRVLAVNGVIENPSYYRDAILLIYKDLDSDQVQLGVELDGEWSEIHAEALERNGAARRLGISAAPAEEALLDDGIVDQSRRLEMSEVLRLQTEGGAEPSHDDDEPSQGRDALDRSAIRWLGVYEHPGYLDDALSNSASRLLIISPWITRSVVTAAWVRRLEKLARHADATIFWGFGDNSKTDTGALDDLHAAARRARRLAIVRVDDTHAKVLVSDDFYIKTSFNWLSFRGSPSRKYRQEEGDLVRDRVLADRAYDKYMTENLGHALEIVGSVPAKYRPLATGFDGSAPSSDDHVAPVERVGARRPESPAPRPLDKAPQPHDQTVSDRARRALEDLVEGEMVTGRVKGITDFGAFVGIDGVDRVDGLIHISELANHRVGHPSEVVALGDTVTVKVLKVERDRKRISLSLKRASR